MPPRAALPFGALILLSVGGCPQRALTNDAVPPPEDKSLFDQVEPDDTVIDPMDATGRADVADGANIADSADAADEAAPYDDAARDVPAAPDARDAQARSGIGNACTALVGLPEGMGDCAEGQSCLSFPAFEFPGGYCSLPCEGVPCPGDSRCVYWDGGHRLCLRGCFVHEDCRAAEGYLCQHPDGVDGRGVCVPRSGPSGLRGVDACFTTGPGPHQLPALARTTFADANLVLSTGRTDIVAAAEGNVVVRPGTDTVVAAYIAFGRGVTSVGSNLTRDGYTAGLTSTVPEPSFLVSGDPVIAYGRDRVLHMALITVAATGGVRVARSTDDGVTWSASRDVLPTGFCAMGCDKPWLVAAPAPGGGEALYLGFAVSRMGQFHLVLIRSDDGGATWSAPIPLASPESVGGSVVVPNLVTFAASPDGTLYAAYTGLVASTRPITPWGIPGNRVALRRSTDGGLTWSATQRVSGPADSVVLNQPSVAVDGSTLYVAYTAGSFTGVWDVMLATSVDQGMSWRYRRVNDEPESCATHAWPCLVADPTRHVVHVTWLENRFGDGAAAYAACPRDAAAPCGRNEAVSDRSFTFSSSRETWRWHGDYQGLVLTPSGALWAAWSDTRTGRPQLYLALGRPR